MRKALPALLVSSFFALLFAQLSASWLLRHEVSSQEEDLSDIQWDASTIESDVSSN